MAAWKIVFSILSLALLAQGSLVVDVAEDFTHLLAEHLGHGMDEVERLRNTATDDVTEHMTSMSHQLVQRAEDKTDKAAAKCTPTVLDQVQEVVKGSITDRFLHCINFTDSITELELYLYNISQQVNKVEEGVCGVITNLSSCKKPDVLQEIHCVTGGLLSYIKDFKSHSSSVWQYIDDINAIIKNMVHQFLKCFTTIDTEMDYQIMTLVNQRC